ncbi:MAG: hypothetical protein SFW35_10400 [Chitinophagales bacterium]|nr:hypothetical protein [Chitinophagales bacterium]
MNQVKWRCPSNIALIKYWGKLPGQIPANASISFTLTNAHTDMELQWSKKSSKGIALDFFFEGKPNDKFKDKILKFLQGKLADMPWLEEIALEIHSSNSFPHSAGIASSASSMGALALCLCSLQQALVGGFDDNCQFYTQASDLARQASGSASRSIYGGLVTWGKVEQLPFSSNQFASPLQQEKINPVFRDFQDAVLIVSKDEKAVSSRAGHALMDTHPFAQARYQQAKSSMAALLQAVATGDMEAFIGIVENEALTLHGLMMNSQPSVVLIKPNTLEIIHRLRTFRRDTGYPVSFTLDAGPNVHVLYPLSIKNEVESFINQEMAVYCANGYWIKDQVGTGPTKL